MPGCRVLEEPVESGTNGGPLMLLSLRFLPLHPTHPPPNLPGSSVLITEHTCLIVILYLLGFSAISLRFLWFVCPWVFCLRRIRSPCLLCLASNDEQRLVFVSHSLHFPLAMSRFGFKGSFSSRDAGWEWDREPGIFLLFALVSFD